MSRFVSFKTALKPDEQGPPFIVVNPDHVALIEPIATTDQPKCRLWLALPLPETEPWFPYRDVQGSLKDVGLRLQDPPPRPEPASTADPLGTFHK